MSASDLIRKCFSAYENKDRKVVESRLTNDFVFTSPYDYRIDRETYFKRCGLSMQWAERIMRTIDSSSNKSAVKTSQLGTSFRLAPRRPRVPSRMGSSTVRRLCRNSRFVKYRSRRALLS